MSEERYAELVVCAAPLARRAPEVAAEIRGAGWQVTVVTSTNAVAWVDVPALARASGQEVVVRSRRPDEPRRRPRPAVVLAVPATFNTLNKLRQGISDTPALAVLNDAVGMRLPLLVVPTVADQLVAHPAWPETLRFLAVVGASVLHPPSHPVEQPGDATGVDDGADAFDPQLVAGWLSGLR